MSSFTAPLEYKIVGKYAYLQRELVFFIDDSLTGEYIKLKLGFSWNGASIPKLIRKLFGWSAFDQRWAAPSAGHDALVGEGGKEREWVYSTLHDGRRQLDWGEAAIWFDKMLEISMNTHKVDRFQRKAFVKLVKAWGLVRG